MNVNKLLRFLLTRFYSVGIVEAGGGAAVVEDEPDEVDDETGDDDQVEDEPTEGDEEGEGEEGAEGASDDEGAAVDEVVVSIGDAEPSEDEDEHRAPPWVRDLRKSNREKDRKLREQEAEIARLKGTGGQPSAVVVGEEPTLENCGYDAEKFARELKAWMGRKTEADQQQRTKTEAAAREQAAWQTKLDAYGVAKTKLKVKDFDDAEALAQDALSVTQQGIILSGAENPALLVYALGKNPKKAKELAAVTDPVKFAFLVAKLETQLKVTPRKSAPPPDRQVRSSVAGAAAVDSQLARLQAEADKTGNRTKVAQYLRTKNKAKQGA